MHGVRGVLPGIRVWSMVTVWAAIVLVNVMVVVSVSLEVLLLNPVPSSPALRAQSAFAMYAARVVLKVRPVSRTPNADHTCFVI